jgi:hypothetical protein
MEMIMSNALIQAQQEVICAFMECGQVRAELYLNGFPVLYASRVNPLLAESMHPFLIAGINTFELLIEPGPTPSRAREPHKPVIAPDAIARAWLGGYAEGDPVFPDQGRRIADIKFHRGSEKQDLEFPASFYASFDLGEWHGPLAWQNAPPLRLDDETRNAAFATLRRYEEIHRNADLNAVWEMFGPHIRDFLRIFGWSEADLRTHFQELLAEYADAPAPFLPWKEEDTDFRLVAHGRLIQCVNKDWFPTIRSVATTGQILKNSVYLGVEDRRLRVFR